MRYWAVMREDDGPWMHIQDEDRGKSTLIALEQCHKAERKNKNLRSN